MNWVGSEDVDGKKMPTFPNRRNNKTEKSPSSAPKGSSTDGAGMINLAADPTPAKERGCLHEVNDAKRQFAYTIGEP
jgi:hypothetical protein